MISSRFWLVGLLILIPLGMAGGCNNSTDSKANLEIINVSYDPTRELYQEINAAFSEDYKQKTGSTIRVVQSHAGSGAQARAVIDGLKADVVTLALAGDIDAIAKKGLIAEDWQSRLPENASPYTSTIVFQVRAGNPKGIKDWPDLIRPGVKIITPNPKTSGGARWNFLAAWGYITLHKKGTEDEARKFVRALLQNVVKLDTGARGATQSFAQNKLGDVLIAWENDAILAQKERPKDNLEIIYPSVSVLAEPPVAVVDKNVDAHGTRAAAVTYLKFLYTDAAQEIIGKNSYRPSNPAIRKKYAATLPEIKLFTLREVAGSWAEAQKTFFGDGGVFDQVYSPGKK